MIIILTMLTLQIICFILEVIYYKKGDMNKGMIFNILVVIIMVLVIIFDIMRC